MKNTNLKKLVGTALLAAVLVVLQTVVSSIRIGMFTITLSMVPIIIGAIMYGPACGGFLGAVFGVMVVSSCISGADAGGLILITAKPVATVFIVMLKGIMAGVVAGWVYKLLRDKNEYLATAVAAIAGPTTNTGIFAIACGTIFIDIVSGWAAGSGYASSITYIIAGLVGVNFLVEMAVNVILVPVIVRVVEAVRKS